MIPPDDVPTVAGYDAVVLGSGVYAGHWLKPARAFVERHELALKGRPVFLFSSGPIGDPLRPGKDPAEVAEVDEMTLALDHRVFAGHLNENELGAAERLVIRIVGAPYGDFRSWDDITDWARTIATFMNTERGALIGVVDS